MPYEQNKLAYSRTSNMPGLEYSQEDISQKKRIATNALGTTPPADLLDGEFFLKDNDPQDFYRTLYIKRGESLDKILTVTDTGKVLFDGINIVNLDDDEEVTGVLPKKKIITAAATAKYSAVYTFVGYDGKKFQEVEKDDFVNKVVEDVNAGIDLAEYLTKQSASKTYFNKDTDVLNIKHGGHGGTTKEQAQNRLGINDFKRNNYERLDLNKATNGVLVARTDYLENRPSNLISSGEIIVETVLGQNSTTFSDNDKYTYNLQTYKTRNSFEYAKRVCKPNGVVGEWKKLRNPDGSIPADLIPATVLKYKNSDGVWTETKLTTGEVMLEGWGVGSSPQKTVTISLPKSVKATGSIVGLSVYGLANAYLLYGNAMLMSCYRSMDSSSSFIIETSEGAPSFASGYSWEFKGILAQ